MPSFKGKLTDAQIKQIADYVSRERRQVASARRPAARRAARGAALG